MECFASCNKTEDSSNPRKILIGKGKKRKKNQANKQNAIQITSLRKQVAIVNMASDLPLVILSFPLSLLNSYVISWFDKISPPKKAIVYYYFLWLLFQIRFAFFDFNHLDWWRNRFRTGLTNIIPPQPFSLCNSTRNSITKTKGKGEKTQWLLLSTVWRWSRVLSWNIKWFVRWDKYTHKRFTVWIIVFIHRNRGHWLIEKKFVVVFHQTLKMQLFFLLFFFLSFIFYLRRLSVQHILSKAHVHNLGWNSFRNQQNF